MEGEWELRQVRVNKGAHRSRSSATPGAERDLLRDNETGKLLGPTESVPVDEDELRSRYVGDMTSADYYEPPEETEGLSPTGQIIAERLSEVGEIFLSEVVIPVIRRKWRDWRGTRRSAMELAEPREDAAAPEEKLQLTGTAPLGELQTVADQPLISMTQDQYEELHARELAFEEAARQARILRGRARIVESNLSLEDEVHRTLQEDSKKQLDSLRRPPDSCAAVWRDTEQAD